MEVQNSKCLFYLYTSSKLHFQYIVIKQYIYIDLIYYYNVLEDLE